MSKAVLPEPCPGILALAPYKQGGSQVAGVENPIKLSSNESHHGPSPKALAAYRTVGETLFRYPDGNQTALRTALAETFDLDVNGIVCGNGSDELIQMVIRAYVRPGDDVVISQYSFAMANIHATAQGANVIIADEPDLRPDTDRILAAMTEKTRMVVLASPNNPCGRYPPSADLRRLYAALPPDVVLVVDAAYADYVTAPDFEDGSALVGMGGNAVMTRTFSKIYGLSSLRIGWMYCPPNIFDAVQRIRTPFNTNGTALAVAEAAVRDVDFTRAVREDNARELGRIKQAVTGLGITFIDSVANFYLLRFAGGDAQAAAAADFLQQRGIIPRPVGAGGPDGCVRITVGLAEENAAVIAALTDFVNR